MKTSKTAFVAALLAAGIPLARAQSVDTSTGTVLDASDASSGEAKAPAPKIISAIRSNGENSKTRGVLAFSNAGDGINANGRIEGLEPNKRYSLSVVFAASGDGNASNGAGETNASPPSQAGTPDSGAPAAGAPVTGGPRAGAPDGETRPGTPGGGTSGTGTSGERPLNVEGNETDAPAKSGKPGELGTILADAAGGANVSSTLRHPGLTDATALVGGMVVLRETPQPGASGEGLETATGKITSTAVQTAAEGDSQAPTSEDAEVEEEP